MRPADGQRTAESHRAADGQQAAESQQAVDGQQPLPAGAQSPLVTGPTVSVQPGSSVRKPAPNALEGVRAPR